MIVIIRLDLDKYDLKTIERLTKDGVITMGEATESRVVQEMSEFERLMWVRAMQAERVILPKSA